MSRIPPAECDPEQQLAHTMHISRKVAGIVPRTQIAKSGQHRPAHANREKWPASSRAYVLHRTVNVLFCVDFADNRQHCPV